MVWIKQWKFLFIYLRRPLKLEVCLFQANLLFSAWLPYRMRHEGKTSASATEATFGTKTEKICNKKMFCRQ